MRLRNLFLILMLLITSIGIESVNAAPIDDIIGYIRENTPSLTIYGGNGCYAEYGWRAGRGVSVIYNSAGVEIGYVDPTTVDSVGAYMQNLDPPWGRTYVCSPKIEATPTPTSTSVITPTPTSNQDKPKPVIIPPAISRLFDVISSWITGLFGLSIQGGVAIDAGVNQPYTSAISLPFQAPDIIYTDGSYESKYGEWFIVDSSMKLLHESGWSPELTTSPYTATASFTPTSPGTYYLIGVIVRQNYVYEGNAWTVTETIETKEIQKITVRAAPTTTPPQTNILTQLISWIMSMVSIFG